MLEPAKVVAKLPRIAQFVDKVIDFAKRSPAAAERAVGWLRGIADQMDSVKNFLPQSVWDQLAPIRKKIDDFLAPVKGFSGGANIAISQLEKKWKHAVDFGITTTKRNASTLADFQRAIVSHLDDAATVANGTYQYVAGSKVFFNPNTNLVVILDSAGNFVSGWKLVPGTPQFLNFINNGILR